MVVGVALCGAPGSNSVYQNLQVGTSADWRRCCPDSATHTREVSCMKSRQVTNVAVLSIALCVLASCAGISHTVVDSIPAWAGGLLKNVPPRPGTPEYDAWMQQREAEAGRDKSKDPPKPKTDVAEKTPMMGGSPGPGNP